MANARSRTDWKRSSGLFSRQRQTTRTRDGGEAGAQLRRARLAGLNLNQLGKRVSVRK